MKRNSLALAVLATVAMGACADYNGARNPWQAQHNAANHYRPKKLEGGPAEGDDETGAPANRTLLTLHARVWADAAYRGENPRWKDRVKNRFFAVNEYLRETFAVQIEVDDVQPWDRPGRADDLDHVLEQLAAVDPGDGVDWVVGFTTSLPTLTSSMHKIGTARLLGKHFILRGMDDTVESHAIDAAFPQLDEKERRDLYLERKDHKELVTFLHEWGHTLGAIHVNENDDVMSGAYSEKATGFSRENAHVIGISLDHRRAKSDDKTYLAALADYVEGVKGEPWNPHDRSQLATLARGRTGAATGARTEDARAKGKPAAPELELPEEERGIYVSAMQLAEEEHYADAWRTLAPLSRTFVHDRAVQRFGCQLAAQPEVVGEARDACRRLIALVPDDPEPWIDQAHSLLNNHDRLGASQSLLGATKRVIASGTPADWGALASLWAHDNAPTLAELSATHADEAKIDEIATWARRKRRWLGLPPTELAVRYQIAPDDEPDYAERVEELIEAVQAKRPIASKLIFTALSRYPDAPGLLALRGALELRAQSFTTAEKDLRRAIAEDDESFWAHLTLGETLAAERKPGVAAEYERAIALIGDIPSVWQLCARVYEKGHAKAKLDDLAGRYKAQFHEEMTW